jgi:hypothetical protein
MLSSFIVLGGAALIVALVLAFAVGRTARRVGVVLATGLLLVALWGVLGIVLASEDQACHDCGRYFGKWIDPVFFLFLAFNALGWTAGSLIGAGLRRLRAA